MIKKKGKMLRILTDASLSVYQSLTIKKIVSKVSQINTINNLEEQTLCWWF